MNIIQQGRQAFRWIKERLGMTNRDMALKDVFKEKDIRSGAMKQLQDRCRAFYKGEANHNSQKVPSLRLPVTLCNEVSRDVYTDSKFCVCPVESVENTLVHVGYLHEQLQRFTTKKLLSGIVKLLADGTIALRSFPRNGKIHTVVSTIRNFSILAVDDVGDVKSIAFKEKMVIGKYYYTLIEKQTFERDEKDQGYMSIEYEAYRSDGADDIGNQIPLSDVSEWAEYENMFPEPFEAEHSWFVVVKTPLDNTVDDFETPYGVPLFAYALEFIKRADLHFARTEREIRVTARKIFTNHKFAPMAMDGQGNVMLGHDGTPLYMHPDDEDGLLVLFDGEKQSVDKFIEHFAPIPNVEVYNQYMEQLRRIIEYIASQSYGTISENPTIVTPSPTQLNATKRRNVRLNDQLQQTMTELITSLVHAQNEIAVYAGYILRGEYQVHIEWDASLKRDEQLEITKAQRESENRKRDADAIISATNRGILSQTQAFDLFKDLYPKLEGEYVKKEEELYPNMGGEEYGV